MGNKVSKSKPSIDLNAETIPSPSTSTPTITARLSNLSSTASKVTPIPETPHHMIYHSSFPSTLPISMIKSQQKRESSFMQINNGVTGVFISYKITKIAYKFWKQHIMNLSTNERLEIACALYFGALASDNKQIKETIRIQLIKNTKTIEQIAVKYLEMIEWLIRCLIKDNIDLYSLLSKLGIFHQKMNIKINHFAPLLESIHETLSHYYPKKYNIKVKYAMDEIFIVSSQIMTGQDVKFSPHLNAITASFGKENNINFIKNLKVCLQSNIGREYLYRFLQETYCDEIATFLQLLSKFKGQSSDIQRFMIAREVVQISIQSSSNLTINISYNCRKNILIAMTEMERQFKSKQDFNVNSDFFSAVELEIYKLILENHWNVFVRNIKELHSKSFKY